MYDKFADDCLALHASHAQPIVQEEAAMAAAFLGSDSPLQLLANDMAGVVVSATGKAKVGLVALQLQSAADHDVSVLGRFGSSCIAKEMDGNVLSSSFFFVKENDASLLGKMVARASFTKVGVAPLLLPTAASLSNLKNDLGNLKDVWKYCIVGYVVGKFPRFKALNHLIVNSWKCKASPTIHESGWLVYRFMREEDKLAVLSGGPYLVYGQPLILKSMPEFFDFSTADMSIVSVWIKLPNLPL
ncbi:hypothetical protein OIU76_024818 [Salix suchowensis]|nr:hypothetical protein OIU76_024818 [Salix suchowensis]